MRPRRIPAITVIVLSLVSLGIIDNILSEEPWVPDNVKSIVFYLLPSGILIGLIALMPYLKDRLSLLRPERISNLILVIAIATSAFLTVAWGIVYYRAQFFGTASIAGTALIMKDIILALASALFVFVGTRLLRWFLKSRDKVVLGWSIAFLSIVPYSLVRLLPDLLHGIDPATLENIFWLTRFLQIPAFMYPAYAMGIPYYGWRWLKWVGLMLVGDSSSAIASITTLLNVQLDVIPLTIMIFGLGAGTFLFMIAYSRLVHAVRNELAKGYYWGIGYSIGIIGAAGCSLDLGLPNSYPLSGFASMSLMVPAACLCFATFTSAAAYFSISEEVKREIRKDQGFVASMGIAESQISTEQEVTKFYNRFTGLARESGAVEAGSITKDEIYSYASAVKRMQKPSTVQSG